MYVDTCIVYVKYMYMYKDMNFLSTKMYMRLKNSLF